MEKQASWLSEGDSIPGYGKQQKLRGKVSSPGKETEGETYTFTLPGNYSG